MGIGDQHPRDDLWYFPAACRFADRLPDAERLGCVPGWMEMDLGALLQNLDVIRGHLKPHMKIIASVKANAYGHGVVPVAAALSAVGVDCLATGSFADAVAIRNAGVETPVLLFAGVDRTAATAVIRFRLTPTIYDLESARTYSEAASGPVGVYVKVDAGFGRLGVPLDEAQSLIRRVAALPRLEVEGVYTHVPFADQAGLVWATARLGAFLDLLEALRRDGIQPAITQALSSSGILAGIEDHCSAVCPGHALYGLQTLEPGVGDAVNLGPVLRAVRTRVIDRKRWRRPASVGLGGHAAVRAGETTGVVSFGMNQGYYGSRQQEAALVVRGRRAPVLCVSLEHTTIDVTGIPDVELGSEASIIGGSDGDAVTLTDIARWQERTPLEVALSFSGRLPCKYRTVAGFSR
jgi:alanine racemase